MRNKRSAKHCLAKHRSAKNRMILAICIAVGALLAVLGTTAAIYTSQIYQRSVVRNRDNDIICFGSDKLYRVTVGTDPQVYYYPMGEGQNTMTFQVCNYDQAKNTLFNKNPIEYTTAIQVKNGTPSSDYTISNGSKTLTLTTDENGEGTVNFDGERLAGQRKSTNSYTVTFAEGDFNRIEVYVTVTPEDLALTQNRILNGILIPIEYASTQGVTVRYEFPDSTRNLPGKFDAYNLLVSVSGGAGDVLITWDHTKLDMDPFFLNGKATKTDGNLTTVTVPMNSNDETGSYLIQFYNHTSEKPTWKTWSELPISVKLEEPTT